MHVDQQVKSSWLLWYCPYKKFLAKCLFFGEIPRVRSNIWTFFRFFSDVLVQILKFCICGKEKSSFHFQCDKCHCVSQVWFVKASKEILIVWLLYQQVLLSSSLDSRQVSFCCCAHAMRMLLWCNNPEILPKVTFEGLYKMKSGRYFTPDRVVVVYVSSSSWTELPSPATCAQPAADKAFLLEIGNCGSAGRAV